MPLQFKQCTEKELEVLIEISKTTFIDAFASQNNPIDFNTYIEKAFCESKILSELQNNQSHFYLVYLDKTLVGYFKLNEAGSQTDINDKNSMELERIYVLKEFQGQKIGEQMLHKVIELTLKQNVTYLWLGVWEKNPRAIKFYERYGFEKFGQHTYMIGNDKQTDYLMKLLF